MILTEETLKGFGLTPENVKIILDAQTEIANERDRYQKESAGVKTLTKERDDARKQAEAYKKAAEGADTVKTEFDEYKRQVTAEKLTSAKKTKVREALKNAKARENLLDLLEKDIDLNAVELDANGELKDADGLINPIKEKYASVFGTEGEGGTPPVAPPVGGAKPKITKDDIKKMTPEEINQNWKDIQSIL